MNISDILATNQQFMLSSTYNMRRFWETILTKKTLFKGSAVLASTTVLSYALGVLRDRMFAITFGASRSLDAYNAAFALPDLILNIFVAGALTAAFVPIFSDLRANHRDDEAKEFVNSVINGSLLVVIFSGILVFIFTPFLSRFIVPGFDSQSRDVFINIVRMLLLSPIIFAISNTLGNIILTHEKFFWYGISAACYNLGIILGTIFLVPYFGIYGVAIGTIFGALLHLMARLIGLGYPHRYLPVIKINKSYRQFIRLMLPKIIGQPLEQLTFLGYTIIASTISAGSIAILNFARNFQSAPVSTIGITIALATFPVLAKLSATNQIADFKKEMGFSLKMILIISIPAALVIYLLRNILIGFFLGGGAFGPEAVRITGATLGVFSLSIPTESLSHLIARGFYALKDSITPVIIGLAGLIIAIFTGYLFSRSMGIEGLALGFVVGSLVKTVVLYGLLQYKSNHLQ